MRRRWFFFFLSKSISQRKGRIIIASASVTLAVTVLTGMVGLTAGIKEKLGGEIKAYGANMVVSAEDGGHLSYDALDSLSRLDNVEDATGQLFFNAVIEKKSIEVIGLDLGKIRDKGWRLFGNWPVQDTEILAGVNLRDMLNLKEGQTISLMNDDRKAAFRVCGFVERGGPEDSAFLVSIPVAWKLMGIDHELSAILVRGKPGELDRLSEQIKNILPSASVKTLRQVAFAEESLLTKIQILMGLITVVVLFASAISVAATMGANVLERREEIGLMKAVGATRRRITLFYRAEAFLIGFSGGIAGFIMGYMSAQIVSKGAFNSYIGIPLYLPFFSLGVGLVLSILSSHFPVRDAMKENPAVILRGE